MAKKIDITREPPIDIYQGRGRYIRICVALLALVAGGGLLMAYVILAAAPRSAALENAALALIVVPAFVFVYFAEKLKAYKQLSPQEQEKLAALREHHPQIAAYFVRVALQGREPIRAEYEAARDRAFELGREKAEDEG